MLPKREQKVVTARDPGIGAQSAQIGLWAAHDRPHLPPGQLQHARDGGQGGLVSEQAQAISLGAPAATRPDDADLLPAGVAFGPVAGGAAGMAEDVELQPVVLLVRDGINGTMQRIRSLGPGRAAALRDGGPHRRAAGRGQKQAEMQATLAEAPGVGAGQPHPQEVRAGARHAGNPHQ